MVRVLLILVATAPLLGACATLSGSAPSCDGGSRRPLNPSLWDWEGRGPVAVAPPAPSAAAATPRGEEPLTRKSEGAGTAERVAGSLGAPQVEPRLSVAAARPAIDIPGSYRSCAS